jgi:hypothetical protein
MPHTARSASKGMASVLNVVTVHWQSPQWVDVQLRYLERNVDVPWRVFASLNGIDRALWDRFHFAAELGGGHPEKLNELAAIVAHRSAPEDLLLFLDGDAFPVRPVASWFEGLLSSDPLAAVRRDENLGDVQPHPCFCLTTVGFWQEIEGDWRAGEMWENAVGTTTDSGAEVLRVLRQRNISWRPILRSNTRNIHPVWFGVYEHRVYHHGAGFRSRVSRVDLLNDPDTYVPVQLSGLPTDAVNGATSGGRGRRRGQARDERRRARRIRRDEREAAQVFSWITDPAGDFYLKLDSAAGS